MNAATAIQLGCTALAQGTLCGANLRDANLSHADLEGADLRRANLRGAKLRRAYLYRANLEGADLTGADLTGVVLKGASLRGANLTGADLQDAILRGADLQRAHLADGRTWEDYQRDHLAGLCQTPEIRKRAIAAWGAHTWSDCPMYAAHGVTEPTSIEMAAWVALYDAGLLERPKR